MEEETNEVLKSLRNDLVLESQDAANSGQSSAVIVLNRLVNALTRNIERREQQSTEGEV